MARALLVLCRTLSWVQLGLLLTMLGVMTSLVFTRYMFSYSPPWSEELTRFAMIWMVMLGGAVLSLFDDHITLFVFVETMGPQLRAVRDIIVRIIMIAVSTVVAYTGVKFADGMSGVVAWGLNVKMTVPAYSVSVGFGLILIFNSILLAHNVATLFGKRESPIPRQNQVMDGSFRPQDDL